MYYRFFMWMAPFLCFVASYICVVQVLQRSSIRAPHVLGLSLDQACKILGSAGIGMQILRYKQDVDLPHNTVVLQHPVSGESMRPRQIMFLTVSQEPEPCTMPDMRGLAIKDIEQKINALGIKVHHYPIAMRYPRGLCIAHFPFPGSPLLNKYVVLYSALGEQEPIIWPSFIGKNEEEVVNFLHTLHIDPHITYQIAPLEQKGTIMAQHPLAGAIFCFNSAKPPVVQLKIGI